MSATTPWWFVEYKNDYYSSDFTELYVTDQLYYICEKKGSLPSSYWAYSCDDWTAYSSPPKNPESLSDAGKKWKNIYPNTYDEYQATKILAALCLSISVFTLVLSAAFGFFRGSQRCPVSAKRLMKHSCWTADAILLLLAIANVAQLAGRLPKARLDDCKRDYPSYSDQDCFDNVPGSKFFSGTLEIGSHIKFTFGPHSAYALFIVVLFTVAIGIILTIVALPAEMSKGSSPSSSSPPPPLGDPSRYERITTVAVERSTEPPTEAPSKGSVYLQGPPLA